MSKGIAEFSDRVKMTSLNVKSHIHVEKIAGAYWKQDDDSYKTHEYLEFLKIAEIDAILYEMKKNLPLEEDTKRFSDMENEFQNEGEMKRKIIEDQKEIEIASDVDMEDARSENSLNRMTAEQLPEKKLEVIASGKKRIENQKKFYKESKSQPTMENYATNMKKSIIGGLTAVPKKGDTHELGFHVKMTARKTVSATAAKFDKNKPPPLNQEEVLATKEVTPVLKERAITARFNLGNENVKDKVNKPIIARQTFRIFKEAVIIINISYFKCSSMNHTSRGSKETLALLKLRTYAFNLI